MTKIINVSVADIVAIIITALAIVTGIVIISKAVKEERKKEIARKKKTESEIEENFNYEKRIVEMKFKGVENKFIRYLVDVISYGDNKEMVEKNLRRLGLETLETREEKEPITFSTYSGVYGNKYYDSYIYSMEPIMRDYKPNPYDKGYYIMIGYKEGKVSSIRVSTDRYNFR